MTEHDYQVYLPGTITRGHTSFAVKLGRESRDIAKLCAAHDVHSCAFLTAYNPGGAACDPITNLRQQSHLFSFLSDAGLTWFDGAALSEPEQFGQTPCALVMGIDLPDAHFAARQFGQLSFVFADQAAIPTLIHTEGHVVTPHVGDSVAFLTEQIRSGHIGFRRDLIALARTYGIEAANAGGLIRFMDAMSGISTTRQDIVKAVFDSPWQRLGEQLESLYADCPDDLILEVGHRAGVKNGVEGTFHVAKSFALGDVRGRFERRCLPRTADEV